MTATNSAEIVLDRYERLEAEFQQFKRKVGTLKNHSHAYLVAVLLEVDKVIKRIDAETEDLYGSRAAALHMWRNYRQDIVSMAKRKKR